MSEVGKACSLRSSHRLTLQCGRHRLILGRQPLSALLETLVCLSIDRTGLLDRVGGDDNDRIQDEHWNERAGVYNVCRSKLGQDIDRSCVSP